MTPEEVVLVGAGALLVVTAVSGRLERAWLTEPLLATALGLASGSMVMGSVDVESPAILTVLELTLALVLFADASRIDVTRLRAGYNWPLRMLVLGLPIAVVMGAVFTGWYLSLPLGTALLLGAILAPTDAALAEPVLGAESVPARVRQTLNVESGLNDGLALPILLIAIGIVDAESGATPLGSVGLVVSQLGIGAVGGVVTGWLGAVLFGKGTSAGWLDPLHLRIAAVALAVTGFAATQLLGGSGFVAAFIAGALMSRLIRPRSEQVYQFAATEGHALVLVAFFIFGAGPGAELLGRGLPVEGVVAAAVSLVVLRPAAIALSLAGERLRTHTLVFLGWFGPRGLATMVFMLVAVEGLAGFDPLVRDTVTVTVLLSVVAHGLTAVPMSRWLAGLPLTEDMPEMGETYVHPTRR